MDQSSGSDGPRVVEFRHPAPDGGSAVGRIISRCRDSAAALQMVGSQASSLVIVADGNVAALHDGYLGRLISQCPVPVHILDFPAGESSKSMAVLESLLGRMALLNVDRSCLVVGFGGGVATDIAAMVASLWMRGVRLVQIPTSLLAMADAAIGGKGAVNLREGRNLAGCIKFPEYVFIDGKFLETLPEQGFVGGLVEIIKVGILAGPGVLDLLAEYSDWFDPANAVQVAVEAAAIKAEIVSRDPFDRGVRGMLNFGHTVGHAVEAASGYAVGHGQAVAAGLRVESAVSERLGIWASSDRGRLVSLLDRTGIESVPAVDFGAAEPFMLRDKKNEGGRIRLALPRHRPGTSAPADFSPVTVPSSLIGDCWNG